MRARPAAAILLVLLLTGAAATSTSLPARAAAPSPAVQEYGGCLNAGKKGDLLFLFDESISLQTSDPEAGRVKAARYLVDQLAEVSDRKSIDLEVSVGGFSDDYQPVLPWTRLGGAGTAQVAAAVEEFRTRDDGVQTDYWSGLNGARSALSAHAEAEGERCQAIVWFSDGKFDVSLSPSQYESNKRARTKSYAPGLDLRDASDAAKARDAAEEDFCRPKGLADQLRVRGITLFAIGLTSPSASRSDFDTMSAVATGSGSCGQRQKPSPGSFTPAEGIDDLLFAFDQIGRPGQVATKPLCQSADPVACRSVAQSFVLDDSITSVHLLATADVPVPKALEVYLFAPGRDAPVQLVRREGGLSPRGSRFEWLTDTTVSVDLVNPDRRASSWTGQWALVLLDPTKSSPGARSTVSISIAGNLFPSWPDQKTTALHTGESVTGLRFGLVDDKGRTVDARRLKGTGTLDAQLLLRDGTTLPVAEGLALRDLGKRATTLALTDVPVGRADLQLSLHVRTADFGGIRGTELAPQVVTVPVDVLAPRGTPQLAQLADFGSVTGPVDAAATLRVTGPGCVWLDGSSPDVQAEPEQVGAVSVTSTARGEGTCLRVAEGQTADLGLRLTTEQPGNGTLAGTVPVVVAPLDALNRQTVVQVPFTADLQRPIQALNFALALVAALLLGPGIPLALLALVKWLTAKIPARPLLAQQMLVHVREGRVLRDGVPLALRDTDFGAMVPLGAAGSRRTSVAGTTLRTRTGLSPFGAGFVSVETSGQVGLSSTHPRPYGRRRQARLPLAVHNTWVATRAASAPRDEATLLLLVGLDPAGDRRRQLVDDVAARLPELMAELEVGPDGNAGVASPPSASRPEAGAAADYLGTSADDPWVASAASALPSGRQPQVGRTGSGAPVPAAEPARSEWDRTPSAPSPQSESWSFDNAFDDDGHAR